MIQKNTFLWLFIAFLFAALLAVGRQSGVFQDPFYDVLNQPLPAKLSEVATWQIAYADDIARLDTSQQRLLTNYFERWQHEQQRHNLMSRLPKDATRDQATFDAVATLGSALADQQAYEQRYPNNPTAALGFAAHLPLQLTLLTADKQNSASGYLLLSMTNLSSFAVHRLEGKIRIRWADNDPNDLTLNIPTQQFIPPLGFTGSGIVRATVGFVPKSAATQDTTGDVVSDSMLQQINAKLERLPTADPALDSSFARQWPLIECQPCVVYDAANNPTTYAF